MFVGAIVLENLPLVYSKTLSRCDFYSLLHAVPKGIVLLCDIGRLELQAKSIVSSNITGAILISNDPINLSIIIEVRCPCIVVHSRRARDLLSYARSSYQPLVSMEFRQTFTKSKPAPAVPPFASRGPSLNFPWVLKPDVMAPGHLILGATISPNGTPESYFQLTTPLQTHLTTH